MPAARHALLTASAVGAATLSISCAAAVAYSSSHDTARPVRSHADCSRRLRPGEPLQRFVDRLGPGAVGCLPPGTYDVQKLTFSRAGTADRPIVLRSEDPAHPATIDGSVWISDPADYVTVQGLQIVGTSTSLPAAIVNGDHSLWTGVDVSSPPGDGDGGICFSLGQLETWGYAGDTTIENSVIHDCGRSTNTNQGIYVQATSGRTVIRDNWIFRNGDRGIQLYPSAQNVLVSHNVIDGNGSGVIFSGDEGHASSNVLVRLNIISNSKIRWNVESSYPDGAPIGSNNVVVRNCFWASGSRRYYDTRGGVSAPRGFTVASGNVIQQPRFVAPAAGDLRLSAASGCRGYGVARSVRPGPLGVG